MKKYQVIKFVAGGGKTTESKKILLNERKGLYLAFTNEVVNDLKSIGILSKTIDSLFSGFLIPKFTSVIPIISTGSIIKYNDTNKLPPYLKGVGNIEIKENGDIYNLNNKIKVNLNTPNEILHSVDKFSNSTFLRYIFSKSSLNLTDNHRKQLSLYILKIFPNEIIDFLNSRFDVIVIDEAQDLKSYHEDFVDLLLKKFKNKIFLFGDENQNIMGGGTLFETLESDFKKTESFRCPEINCKWIRENLDIEIKGQEKTGGFYKIDYSEVSSLDNGKRVLVYVSASGNQIKNILQNWTGKKETIKSIKGKTVENDIVIVGNSQNVKNYYTAITRTTKKVYSTVKTINKSK